MPTPTPDGMLPVTLAAVDLLRPFLPDGRVRLTLDLGSRRRPRYQHVTGSIVCFGVRITGRPRRVVDVIMQEDTAPPGLCTTFPVDIVFAAETPTPTPTKTPPPGIVNHPAWSARDKRLQCHICQKWHDLEATYDRDFLGHNPTPDQAFRWLSVRSYITAAEKRGWPPAGELV